VGKKSFGKSAWLGIIPAILAVIGLLVQSQATAETSTTRAVTTGSTIRPSSGSASGQTTKPSNRSDPRLRKIGFRTGAKFDSHFKKHGAEFGTISKAQYLSMAQDLRDAPLSKTVIEARQTRGNWSRFDRSSGAFLAFEDDLVILTFFKPDDGEAYFRRAAKRSN
jgi:pyocin large subunit-like protein